jgi:hypothetical protein
MNLTTLPKQSSKMLLCNLNDDFKLAEGDVPDMDQAYVVVGFITEGDRIARNELSARRETRLQGAPDTKFEFTEATKENIRERVELEAFLTLREVANLVDEDGEVFPTQPVKNMGRENFRAVWRELPPYVVDALHAAVRLSNPEWDWGA